MMILNYSKALSSLQLPTHILFKFAKIYAVLLQKMTVSNNVGTYATQGLNILKIYWQFALI